MSSTALLTDQYELTMLDAALQAGRAGQRVTFEVFTRRLPPGRRFGVFAGLERLLDALDQFTFESPELEWLQDLRHPLRRSAGLARGFSIPRATSTPTGKASCTPKAHRC